ncbi:MAG TPA: hypothetical protein VFW00_09860 [Rhodocyclaceae bacterium]|nr:hypothetical protein [Rhodocyclaceae bacterium]
MSFAAPDATKLLPLDKADIMPGCACSFTASRNGNAPPLFHWSWVGDKQAVFRDAAGAYRLKLNSERYIPTQRTPPRQGDRMVLYFADAQWQIQVLGSVINSCRPRERNCTGTNYKAQLLIQHEGGERTNVDVWGHCGC